MALRRSLYAWPDEPLGQLHKGVEQIDEEPTRVPLWPLGRFRQHLLNHRQTSQILCLPSSLSFQAYGSKPLRGHVMGKSKIVRRQTEQPTLMWPFTQCSR
jgi:hypothetical protein